jgi:hypothetical protein
MSTLPSSTIDVIQNWITQYRHAPTALPPEMQAAVLNLERHIQASSIPAYQDGQDVTNWVGTLQGKQFYLLILQSIILPTARLKWVLSPIKPSGSLHS